ncbi:MAG: rhodanese-like domain-containing protein [Bdellovibrionales bacterium]|nr:rhodanese-like domain-containing protein [Bdellovibrionales bacterium]
MTLFKPQIIHDIPVVKAEEVQAQMGQKFKIVDVRRPEEFTGELGHIEGAQLVTLGPDLIKFLESADKSQEMVFVCRSGGRSGQATALSCELGFSLTRNMSGGMLRWNELGFSVVK